MDYLTYKGEKWPVKVSYSALKHYQLESGKSVESIESDITNLELLLYYSLRSGCKHENKDFNLEKDEMEFFLDDTFNEFNAIVANSFPTETNAVKESLDSKKK